MRFINGFFRFCWYIGIMSSDLETIVKRNLQLSDRRTSVQLELYIWQSIDAILAIETINLNMLGSELDRRRGKLRLASSMRIFALIYFRTLTTSLSTSPSVKGASYMLHNEPAGSFNCFLESLQLFSQYAQSEIKLDQKSFSDPQSRSTT